MGLIVEKGWKDSQYDERAHSGIVENMSYAVCPDCGKKLYVFGESHVQEIAARYHLPVLAQCPIDPELAKQADLGVIESFETDHLDKAADVVEALFKGKNKNSARKRLRKQAFLFWCPHILLRSLSV